MPVNQRQKIMILGDKDRKRKSSFYKLYCGRGKDFAAAMGSWHISRRGKKKSGRYRKSPLPGPAS